MTAIERLNEILKQLKQLEDDTRPVHYGRTHSSKAILEALGEFSDNLPDITQELESAIIELEYDQEKAELSRYDISR